MEIAGPITVEELHEAHVLSVPKLLRGGLRRRSQQSLNPSKWRLGMIALIGMLALAEALFDPSIGGAAKWGLLLLLLLVPVYQIFF